MLLIVGLIKPDNSRTSLLPVLPAQPGGSVIARAHHLKYPLFTGPGWGGPAHFVGNYAPLEGASDVAGIRKSKACTPDMKPQIGIIQTGKGTAFLQRGHGDASLVWHKYLRGEITFDERRSRATAGVCVWERRRNTHWTFLLTQKNDNHVIISSWLFPERFISKFCFAYF